MGKIGDLFVRLGLTTENFKKGIEFAKNEIKNFGSNLKNMKAGALAVWAAIGTAVTKFAQSFINSSNAIADAWEQRIAGMRASWQNLLSGLSTANPSGQAAGSLKEAWQMVKNVFSNAKAAGDAAKAMTQAFDAEFELVNSVRLQKLAIQDELNELEVMMRDRTLSPSDRLAAAQRYEDLLRPIAEAEVRVYGDMLDSAVSAWQVGTGLNKTKEDIITFFRNIGTHAEQMAAQFPDIMQVYETRKSDAENLPIFNIIAAFDAADKQMSNVRKKLGRTTNAIKFEIQDALEGIADAVKQYGQEDLKLDLEIDIDVDEEGMELADAMLQQLIDNLQEDQARIRDLNRMITDSFVQGFADSVQAVTDAAFGIEGAGFEQALAAFVRPIANMMKQMGELFMAEGLAELQLISGTPAQKIAAGAALVAIGSAIASGLTKLSATVGGASAAGAASSTPTDRTETFEQDITVHVVGTISGNDIVLAGQKTLNKWSR